MVILKWKGRWSRTTQNEFEPKVKRRSGQWREKRTPSIAINVSTRAIMRPAPSNLDSGTTSEYQPEMKQQYTSGVSDYSPSTSSEEQQNLARAGKSKRVVTDDNLGDGISKENDGEREDGCGVSDYGPRQQGSATSGYFDSDEEGL